MDLVEELLGVPFDPELVEGQRPREMTHGRPACLRTLLTSEARRDRVRGMLLGEALGDALGAPHEFRNQVPIERYTGILEHPLWVVRRFQGGRLTGSVGQTTDDTELTIALAGVLAENRAYRREDAISAYLSWANAGKCRFMGYNTRKLFVGVKTIRGYLMRWDALRAQPSTAWSQSNGCLMRCSPLAVLPESEWREAATADCLLTNFHPNCLGAVLAYVRALRELLQGATPWQATTKALTETDAADVVEAIAAGRDQQVRRVDFDKGWVVHAIYCAFLALNDCRTSFQDRIDRVVRLCGDTDTNAAIAGALTGVLCGELAMRAETRTGVNLGTLLDCDVTAGPLARPERYTARRLVELANVLADLG
jgi:ADP-ribosyl-[dinitrogen reductase] hydrolase